MNHEKALNQQRRRRRRSVRRRIRIGGSVSPRLSVFRSHKHIYAQVIDDEQGKTLASANTLDEELRKSCKYGGNCDAATKVGTAIAQRALAAGVEQVRFDRREYKYHGRVAAVAAAAREGGLKF